MNYQHNIRSMIKKELRKENINQKELAKLLRINEATLSRYINGQRGVTLMMAIKIADYFNLSLDEMIGRKYESNSNS